MCQSDLRIFVVNICKKKIAQVTPGKSASKMSTQKVEALSLSFHFHVTLRQPSFGRKFYEGKI